MAKRRSIMSDSLKMECAKELGFFDQVQTDGDFGNVSSRNCGSMVRKAIEIAERSISKNNELPQG
ncbi:MAG TPA: alpha/beta-type small acid-soluble spore protein [Clostridia bacterium]|mgnify:CR=1 FL=1|nr:small, acid-soluble spore protein, alpha/beta type [Clostridia bacterium]HHY06675.1 alpha/beta-type small acid-soluble spore protein [Clostridia bacterium]